ncbi:hypothetical protein CYJ45_09340 [Corynebacterium coyleae]|nr:hypothetical protein CYJ45_09340 [Corynebacterium coyleae]
MRAAAKRWWAPVYGALLVLALTWPFLVPGEAFALRDMMVFDSMSLTRASLGWGDLPARNVPQDALLGILPYPVLFLRVVMVSAAAAAAWAGWKLGRTPLGQAAAMTVAVWNPFVVERLLQGQWSLAAAAWLLPLVALGVHPLSGLAHWLASLTPTGAIAAACVARSPLTTALTCAPWVVAGIFAGAGGTSSAVSAEVFAPRAEGLTGTLGALVGLGGIWNAHAVPASREAGFALFGIALFVLLALAWRDVPRRLLVLAGVGFCIALASWAGLLGPVVAHVPGAGLLRDSQKWLILTIPALVTAAGALSPRRALAGLTFALLQVPDAPVAVVALTPTTVEVPAINHHGRDVLFESRPTLTLIDDHPTVDPAPKAMNVVESGALTVDGVVVDPPSPRWIAAQAAIDDTDALHEMGIGVVVRSDGRVVDTQAAPNPLPPAGIALFALWLAVPATLRRNR